MPSCVLQVQPHAFSVSQVNLPSTNLVAGKIVFGSACAAACVTIHWLFGNVRLKRWRLVGCAGPREGEALPQQDVCNKEARNPFEGIRKGRLQPPDGLEKNARRNGSKDRKPRRGNAESISPHTQRSRAKNSAGKLTGAKYAVYAFTTAQRLHTAL